MPSFIESFGPLSATLHGLVVSSILLPATFTSLFAGAVSDSLGRPRAIALGALFFAIGAALEAGAITLGMLIAGRCVVGAGEGLFLSNLVV
jgi:MFS family permease